MEKEIEGFEKAYGFKAFIVEQPETQKVEEVNTHETDNSYERRNFQAIVIDVLLKHERDLSDGFQFYSHGDSVFRNLLEIADDIWNELN